MTDQTLSWTKSYPKALKWDAPITPYPVHQLLEKATEHYGAHNGFNFLGNVYSWDQLNEESKKLAKGLQSLGLGKGDHIGLMLPNCPFFIISYYALLRIGATVVHYNPLYSKDEVASLIKESNTKMMITVDLSVTMEKLMPVLEHQESCLQKVITCRFQDALPKLKSFLFGIFKRGDLYNVNYDAPSILPYNDLIDNDGNYKATPIDVDNDVALLQFTGGTTGLPKAAMLTHANLSSNTEQCALWFSDAKAGAEKIAAVLPFFHVFAMTAILNLGTRFAMEIVALPRFDLKQTLKMLQKESISFFPAVPAIYNAINNFKNIHKYDISSVRICVSGGAPLPEDVKKSFEDKTGCVLVEGYGLTESSPVVCVNPIEGANKSGSIGLPLPNTMVSLRDLENPTKDVEKGARGELCIKGPQVMKGYYNQEEETANCMTTDGYLRTGDVAIMDEDGYFFIVDRIKDLIISNGYNIYPRVVEEAIYKHPAVEECIVAGLPDENRGEAVKAWIKLKDGKSITTNDLKSFLQDKLSPLEMPRHIEFRDEPLPKTMIGKLSRKDILEEEKQKQ